MTTLFQDLRYALRQLRLSPGSTFTIALVLACGIGVNLMIVGGISVLLLKPLPVQAPEQLVVMDQKDVGLPPMQVSQRGFSYPDYIEYRDGVAAFSALAAHHPMPVHLSIEGQRPERTWIEVVSANYFSTLGIGASQGRVFSAAVDHAGAAPVVVLDHSYWERRLNRDASIVGKAIRLDGRPATVVGVGPATFHGTEAGVGTVAYVPVTAVPAFVHGGEALLQERDRRTFRLLGRLGLGTSQAQAEAEARVVASRIAQEHPRADNKKTVVSLMSETRARPSVDVADIVPVIVTLVQGLAALVLLIACANAANLLLSRTLARQRELGIRSAVGASRWRLLRQMLTESTLLGVLGGALGLALALGAGIWLGSLQNSADLPQRSDYGGSDWWGLILPGAFGAATGLVTGLIPALKATRPDVVATLKEGSASFVGSRRHLFRSLLVVSQVAVSFVLLSCGALFLQSLLRTKTLDIGFQPDHLLLASVDLEMQNYGPAQAQRFQAELLARAASLPGVQAVALANAVPFGLDAGFTSQVRAEGQAASATLSVPFPTVVSADYFATMGIPLVQGRGFTGADISGAAVPRAIVNQTLAEQLWPNRNPLGMRFHIEPNGAPTEVVGVARNSKYGSIGETARPHVYVPMSRDYTGSATVHLRSAGDPAALAPALRRVIQGLDPDLPLFGVRSMREHIDGSATGLYLPRLGGKLAGAEGLLGLALALMGLYAVIAFVAGQRTHEIGIRMALGASRARVVGLIMRGGVWLTATGLAIGALGALGATFVLSRVLHGIRPSEPLTLAGVAAALTAVSLLACYWPARRAAKVDPMVALRCD
jgi:predicted permease